MAVTPDDDDSKGIQSLARTKLLTWMRAEEGRSQGYIARKLGVSQPAVRGWVKGISRPEPPLRAALEMLCGIPPADWELAEEREQLATALANIAKGDEAPPDSERKAKPESSEPQIKTAPTGTDGDR